MINEHEYLKNIGSLPGELNAFIKVNAVKGILDTNNISDGYHTFGELYDHRIELYIQLCSLWAYNANHHHNGGPDVWRTQKHSDGSCVDGWFLLGMNKGAGSQITYHLPMSRWDDCSFAETLERAPEFDGHTSADVLKRLREL